jgi:predicted RNA-binding Zn-ribbon protein involved in translation (DUF1610 family)
MKSIQNARAAYAPITKNRPGKSQGVAEYDLPKCGFTITPDLVKRVDFERMECPKCGEKFRPGGVGW